MTHEDEERELAKYDEPPDREGDEYLRAERAKFWRAKMVSDDEKVTEPVITPAPRAVSPTIDPERMRRFGRAGYEAYARFTGGKTYDGKSMPSYDELTPRIKDAWAAAASGVLVETTKETP